MEKFDPFLYHLSNIIIHALNSILVFFFLLLFFRPLASLWGSLVFAVHPIHTEAVSWISGRPYILSAFFLMASFLFYVRQTAVLKARLVYLLAALFSYFLALRSCAFAVFYPGMLVLYDLAFSRRRNNWQAWLFFFALMFIHVFFMLGPGAIRNRAAYVAFDTGQQGFSNPIYNMAVSIFSHLGLLIWPKDLTLYHEPLVVSKAALAGEIFFLALLILSLPLLFKKARVLFFALGIFILFLAPTYSPAMISWLVAERYLYFPSLALSMAVASIFQSHSMPALKLRILNTALIFLIAAYSVCTIIRNFDWRSHASIWRATVKVSPLSAKARNNMGDVYCLEGKLDKALEEFRRAILLKPNYADAYHNLALTEQKIGRINDAALHYQKAISTNPRLYQSYQNLGLIYLQRGQAAQAEEYLKKARELNPK